MAVHAKRILITEPRGPLGRKLVETLKGQGHSLVLASVESDLPESLTSHSTGAVRGHSSSDEDLSGMLDEAEKLFGGKSPNVLILNSGGGGKGMLDEPREGPMKSEDLQEYVKNVNLSYKWIQSYLPRVCEHQVKGEGEEEGEEHDGGVLAGDGIEKNHILLLGCRGGIDRHSFAGAYSKAAANRICEGVRDYLKDSNVNLTLLDACSDPLSTTGRVVMWESDEAAYDDPFDIDEDVPNVVSEYISHDDIQDVAKVIWPVRDIKLSPLMQKSFEKLRNNGSLPKANKLYIPKQQAVAIEEAVVEEETVKEPEKTHFTVKLAGVDNLDKNKLKIIKALKSVTGLSLMQCKELLTSMPSSLGENIPKEEAEKIVEELSQHGGKVELE